MDTVSLLDVADQHLARAHQDSHGRSSVTVYGGRVHRLRQTLITLVADQELAEHPSPDEATLQVLRGRIVLRTSNTHWDLPAGAFVKIPAEAHSVEAVEDSAFILTVALSERHDD